MPLNRLSRNTLVSIFGFGGILAGFLALGYYPAWSERGALERDIAGQQATLAEHARLADELQDLTRRASSIAFQVRNYDRLVPPHKDLGVFLGQLSHQLDQTGMKDTAVRALQPTSLRRCEQLPIEVRGAGTFGEFHSFLTALESLPRMSSVSRLNVESDNLMTGHINSELTLSIYNTKPE